ncbi:MAG: hypothetical protein JWM74_5347 [Myxococcaceae bacterium]|nr:hypothetical protein [Myxococcaceae bacterium]
MRVLVTGATGNVGREVVRALRARGALVRAAAHETESVRALHEGDVEPVRLDLDAPSTFRHAAEGCEALFLVRPHGVADVALVQFLDAAREHGVRHVVFLSVPPAGPVNRLLPHHAIEAHLTSRSGDWTILRPGFFAQNLGDAYWRDIVEDSRLYVPAGGGRVAFVDVRDIAEVAAIALLDRSAHAGRTYTLTGPEATTFEEAAAILSDALEQPVRYEPASIPRYALHLHERGTPAPQIALQTLLHVALRFGQARAVDPTLRTLLDRRARTLHDYVRDHVTTWRGATS